MTHHRFYASVFLLCASLVGVGSLAQSPDDHSGNYAKGFADYLLAHGFYKAASTEYAREIFAIESEDRIPTYQLYLRAAESNLLAGDIPDALRWTEIGVERIKSQDSTFELNVFRARILRKTERHKDALRVLIGYPTTGQDSESTSRLHFERALNHALLFEDSLALLEFSSVIAPQSLAERANNLSVQLCSSRELPHKSPLVAGALSLCPGMGYAYVGHVQTCISAAVIVGLLTLATIDADQQGEAGVALVTGLFGAGWYVGNVYGSYISAYRFNNYYKEQYITRFLNW